MTCTGAATVELCQICIGKTDCHNYTQIFSLEENIIFYIMTKISEMFIIAHLVNPAHQRQPSEAIFFRDGYYPTCTGYP